MIFERTIQLIGMEKFNKLQGTTVLVFGIGGVGGHVIEALVRSGIGKIILVDRDVVDESNMNRQIIALKSTIGKAKTEIMKERILDINPLCEVRTYHMFYDFESKSKIWENEIDFVVDCIDTITFKIDIIKECIERDIKMISVMGTGNKFHPEKLEILPLSKTEQDPIARVIRTKLRKLHINNKVMVVASKEPPLKVDSSTHSPSSNAFVPATAGLLAASYVFNEVIDG